MGVWGWGSPGPRSGGGVLGGLLIGCAFVGKLACTLGVTERGINQWAVAIGMVPRGEVGLIFAGIGTRLTLEGEPLLSPSLLSAVVLMVLVTTLAEPVGLRCAFTWQPAAAG